VLDYRTATVSGFDILVGRNQSGNEEITFGIAHKDDLWMHADGDTAGSHVVVRSGGRRVPDDVVERAAAYAARYSKGKNAPFVRVFVCRAGDVVKPKRAPVGTVGTPRRGRVVRVKPEGFG